MLCSRPPPELPAPPVKLPIRQLKARLHEGAIRNNQGIAAVIAGHTRRAVFENLSLTEWRYLESKIKTDGVTIKHQPDGSDYNIGSCVYALSIIGIDRDHFREQPASPADQVGSSDGRNQDDDQKI